jgi:hypothetical protein
LPLQRWAVMSYRLPVLAGASGRGSGGSALKSSSHPRASVGTVADALRVRLSAIGVSLALLCPCQCLQVLGCLKELLACLVDRDLFDSSTDFLRLTAVLRRFVTSGMMHGRHLQSNLRLCPTGKRATSTRSELKALLDRPASGPRNQGGPADQAVRGRCRQITSTSRHVDALLWLILLLHPHVPRGLGRLSCERNQGPFNK